MQHSVVPSDFVHLDVRSEYSFLESCARLRPLAQRAALLGMRAMALTDRGNLRGAIRHADACALEGVRAIIGTSLQVRHDGAGVEVLLFARSAEGHRNLLRAVSYATGESGEATIDFSKLAGCARGLLVIAKVVQSDDGDANTASARRTFGALRDAADAGALFVGVSPNMAGCGAAHDASLALARWLSARCVATPSVRYSEPADREGWLCLQALRTRRPLDEVAHDAALGHHGHLLAPDELQRAYAGAEHALESTAIVAEMCEDLDLRAACDAPKAVRATEGRHAGMQLDARAQAGLERRLAARSAGGGARDASAYRARLAHELRSIDGLGCAGYFLTVADHVGVARELGIPVGPARGSASGSLTCYALGITDVDPIRHGLIFERFLNPERAAAYPDIDIDVCAARHDELINALRKRCGDDHIARVVWFRRIGLRDAFRGIAHAVELPADQTEHVAMLLEDDSVVECDGGFALTQPIPRRAVLDPALARDLELRAARANDTRLAKALRLAAQLRGLAAAAVPAPTWTLTTGPVTDRLPCTRTADGWHTQLDRDDVERAGLPTHDILPLRAVTDLQTAVRELEAREHAEPLDLAALPLDDVATYELISSGETDGIFQLDHPSARDAVRAVRPDCFEDLAAVLALDGPEPIHREEMAGFAAAKRAVRELRAPCVEAQAVLAETHGILLYQEQLMEIAHRLAGYSYGEADVLRRDLGKQRQADVERQRDRFVRGCEAHGFRRQKAEQIFDWLLEAPARAFSKSHAVAYGRLTCWCAFVETRRRRGCGTSGRVGFG